LKEVRAVDSPLVDFYECPQRKCGGIVVVNTIGVALIAKVVEACDIKKKLTGSWTQTITGVLESILESLVLMTATVQ
jgi:hypothetical protein